MRARARASAVLSVLGWMFVGACVGAGLGFVVGAVFVAIQQRGETDPLAGEWSGLVVLTFQFWGGVVGGLLVGVAAMLSERRDVRSGFNLLFRRLPRVEAAERPVP